MYVKVENLNHKDVDWRQKKRAAEDEMVGWMDEIDHWLNAHEFEQTPGDGEGEESLACCSPWGYKEPGMTHWLNNTTITMLF